MGIVLWIIFGAFAGWIASMFAGTNAQQGLILNIVVGIAGAIIGGWLMVFFGQKGVSGYNLYSLGVSVLGAVILLVIVKAIRHI